MMPSWKILLQLIALIAIGGFVLTILSGFWHVLALLALALVLPRFWPNRPAGKSKRPRRPTIPPVGISLNQRQRPGAPMGVPGLRAFNPKPKNERNNTT